MLRQRYRSPLIVPLLAWLLVLAPTWPASFVHTSGAHAASMTHSQPGEAETGVPVSGSCAGSAVCAHCVVLPAAAGHGAKSSCVVVDRYRRLATDAALATVFRPPEFLFRLT
jgi:hypothetical protein